MKFSDLISQPYCENTEKVDAEYLGVVLSNTPQDVIEQFYSDHGRNPDFQDQFKNLNISNLNWQLVERPAKEIVSCALYPRFSGWFNNVRHRPSGFHKNGWQCIDTRKSVVEYWERNRTWLKNPVFIQGKLLGLRSPLRLVEGHTRVGLLKGLLEHGILDPATMHRIWLGTE